MAVMDTTFRSAGSRVNHVVGPMVMLIGVGAAVTAVVLSATAETETAAGGTAGRRAQNRRARLGLRLRPGRGAWRRTLPFR